MLQMHKCDACGRCKQRRRNFHKHAGLVERPEEERAGEVLCLDIHVFLNCAAHDGTLYRANFTDPFSTATFSYSLVAKSQLMECFDLVVAEYHVKYNLRPWRTLHCDQEGALTSQEAQAWMEDHGVEHITSPTDTPELNGVAEEVNAWLGKATKTMLHHAGRPVTFWTDAYDYAVQVKFVLPMKTARGFMSAEEYLTSEPPFIGHFRVWGCKAFVLEPRTEHRKDFHPPSVMGFFLSLSVEPLGWKIWVPELRGHTIAVNVTFDEVIPDPGAEYHRMLNDAETPVAPEAMSQEEVTRDCLHKHYLDDEDNKVYEVLKIRRTRDNFLVAEVKALGARAKERRPVHVADVGKFNQHRRSHPRATGSN